MARFWLSYDIYDPNNYLRLYEWLDNLDAVECGNSVASFIFDGTKDDIKNNLFSIGISEQDRMYLIYKDNNNQWKGSFIIGKRKKNPPWFGVGSIESDEDE